LIPYLSRPPSGVNQWSPTDFDNFRFVVHELYLYTLAVLLNAEHFDAATLLLAEPLYVLGNSDFGKNASVSYIVFRDYIKSLETRNQRLKLKRVSLRADLLEQGSKTSGVPFRHVMLADFVCFFRADLISNDDYNRWWPETSPYMHRAYGPFEMFARCVSRAYLARVLKVLGAPDLATIKAKLEDYQAGRVSIPQMDYRTFSPSVLMGFDQLGTKA